MLISHQSCLCLRKRSAQF